MNRPVDIQLRSFRFPVTAISSITHRVTGVLLFFAILPALFLLQLALGSEAGFVTAGKFLSHPAVVVLTIPVIFSACFHAIAGLRHLIQDLGFWEELSSARASAYAVWGLSAFDTIAVCSQLYL